MRKRDVQVGGRYLAKVSGQVVIVRIKRELPTGGWVALNQSTGRTIRIYSAQRLRGAATE